MHYFAWFKKNVIAKQWGRKNLPNAVFKVGQQVRIAIAPVGFKHWIGEIVRVRAMNSAGDGIEYLVTRYPVLLWEENLEGV
jgi:hypothetical protein